MYYLDPRQQYLLPPETIQKELNLGRAGHYYQTRLASYNRIMTIQLLSFDPASGMVSMNVYLPRRRQWIFHQEHNTDMFGLSYLGTTPQLRVEYDMNYYFY